MSEPVVPSTEAVPEPLSRIPLIELEGDKRVWTLEIHAAHLALFPPGEQQPFIFLRADAGTRFIRIWRLGGDAYCLQIHDVGTFTTFAGLSPEGTGTVRGGVTGTFDGTLVARLYGKFAPTVPTTGSLGNFDLQCGQDGTCAVPFPSIRRLYFPSGYQNVDVGAFTFAYDGGACGNWYGSNSGDFGDIVC